MKKRIIALIGTCTMLASNTVFGATNQVGSGNTVHLSGCTNNPNSMVSVEVYPEGKSGADLEILERANYGNVIILHDQTTADENGNYSFDFNLNKGFGRYVVVTKSNDGYSNEESFVFVDAKAFNDYYQELYNYCKSNSESASVSKIVDDLNNKGYIFGYSDAEVEKANKNRLATIIYNEIKDNGVSPSLATREGMWNTFDKYYFVERCNTSDIDNIYNEDFEISGFKTGRLSSWYEKSYINDKFKSKLTERITDKGYKSRSEYEDALVEAFVLTTIENPDGIKNVEDVLTYFSGEIGISTTNATDTIYSAVAGKTYSSLLDLRTAYNEAKGDTKKNSNVVLGGGGGGGGSKTVSNVTLGASVSKEESTTQTTTQTTTKVEVSTSRFNDIGNFAWANDAINKLAEKQIINGDGKGNFMPGNEITREQFIKIVINAFVPKADEAEITFKDVSENDWFKPFIAKAVSQKITKGLNENEFGVGRSITRQDMCVLIYNAAKAGGISFKEDKGEAFADDESIASYAKEAVYALKAMGAVNGVSENNFEPKGTANRAQAAKIIYELIKER